MSVSGVPYSIEYGTALLMNLSLRTAGKGKCTEDVSAATYDLKLVFNGLPVLTKKGIDGCLDSQFKLPLGFGTLDIKGAACPVKAGTALDIPAIATVSKSCPNGKLKATLEAHNTAGDELFALEYDFAIGNGQARASLRGRPVARS